MSAAATRNHGDGLQITGTAYKPRDGLRTVAFARRYEVTCQYDAPGGTAPAAPGRCRHSGPCRSWPSCLPLASTSAGAPRSDQRRLPTRCWRSASAHGRSPRPGQRQRDARSRHRAPSSPGHAPGTSSSAPAQAPGAPGASARAHRIPGPLAVGNRSGRRPAGTGCRAGAGADQPGPRANGAPPLHLQHRADNSADGHDTTMASGCGLSHQCPDEPPARHARD